jgi:hypothetical protein
MSDLDLTPSIHPGFSLSPRVDGPILIVQFMGNADMEAVAPLAAYLRQVHTEASSLGMQEVKFDLCDLYFMNSSCFKSFVTWIERVSSLTPNPYRIKFAGNPKLHWQRRSLEALRRLAEDVVTVEQ